MRPHCMVGWALWTHRLQHVAASTVGHDCPCGNVKGFPCGWQSHGHTSRVSSSYFSHSLVGTLLRFPLCWDAWVCWPPSQTSLKGRGLRACSAPALRWFPGPLAVLPVHVHGMGMGALWRPPLASGAVAVAHAGKCYAVVSACMPANYAHVLQNCLRCQALEWLPWVPARRETALNDMTQLLDGEGVLGT